MYALIIKKPDTEEEVDQTKVALAADEEWVHPRYPNGGEDGVHPQYPDQGEDGVAAGEAQPLDPELVKAARERR